MVIKSTWRSRAIGGATEQGSKTTHAKTAQKHPEAAPGDHGTAKAQKPSKRLRNPERAFLDLETALYAE
jgi:hypothetical protein